MPEYVLRCTFVVQFCWQGTTASQRLEIEQQKRQAEKKEAEAAGGPAGGF
jgi:hypothetical protein